jgi:hypothetical protein
VLQTQDFGALAHRKVDPVLMESNRFSLRAVSLQPGISASL